MSLTSYRTAPPRGTLRIDEELRALWQSETEPEIRHASCGLDQGSKQKSRRSALNRQRHFQHYEWALEHAPAAKPGDDLLFHCLGSSTIGAVRFHGRVRDGIGWVTDAMVTKL